VSSVREKRGEDLHPCLKGAMGRRKEELRLGGKRPKTHKREVQSGEIEAERKSGRDVLVNRGGGHATSAEKGKEKKSLLAFLS